MKVAVLGVFGRPSTCTGFADGLAACGASVVRIGTEDRASSPMVARALAASPTHAVVMKGLFMPPDDVAWLRDRVDTTYVTYDTVTCGPQGREASIGGRGMLAHRVVATGAEAVRWFRDRGMPCAQVFQGHRPEIWRPGPAYVGGARGSLLFTGHFYAGDGGRAEKLRALSRAGLPVDRLSDVHLEECAQLNWEAAVVLNLVPQRSPGSFSNRVVRALASGALVLSEACEDLVEVRRRWVEGGREPPFALFGDDGEMVEKARFWLSDGRGRDDVVESGRAWAAEHTWVHQAAKFLDFVRGMHVPDDGAAGLA